MENGLCYHLHLPDLPRYVQYDIRGSNFNCACILLILAHLSDVKAIEHVVFMIVFDPEFNT